MPIQRVIGCARRLSMALTCFAALVSWLAAAEPTIRNLNVRGLQIGGATTLAFDGDDFGAAPRLLLPFAAKQELKSGASDKRAIFEVSLAGDVVPGYYNLRLVTDGGVSLPLVVAVDRLPQQALSATTDKLPVALHGAASGSSVVETKFTGQAGQKLLVEVESQRLGGKLRPIVHLYNAKRMQLAWSWNTPSLLGDTRLAATLPADGTYLVTVHDSEYAAAAPGFFRLRLGEWSSADRAFPPVVKSNTKTTIELLGRDVAAKVDLAAQPSATFVMLPWPKDGLWSGPRPFVRTSAQLELLEPTTPGTTADLPAGPVAVSGRLSSPGEEDRYRLAVAPNSKLRLEVFAERYGSPLDVAIVIRNDKGDLVVRGEDGPGTLDPILDYTVPDKTTSIVVGVVDALGQGGPRGVYRLVCEPLGGAPRADYQLSTTVQRVALAEGGRAVAAVLADRRGYTGPIELRADSLPKGLNAEGTTIPAEADGALITLAREGGLNDAVVTTWQGRAADGLARPVMLKGHPAERVQPWLATELAIAPTKDKASEFQVDWRDMPSDARLIPADKLPLTVKLVRAAENTAVRLSLVTSQIPPVLANNQPDVNRTLRAEKAVELGAKVGEGEVTLLVPAEMSSPVYDVTVQAELLSADKKTVLSIAFAPVKRLSVSPLIAIELAGPARIEAPLEAKGPTTVKIAGKVERREGFKGDVTVTLVGLPTGIAVNPVTVKADANDFLVNVALPPTTQPGEITGLKLNVTGVPDAKQPNIRTRSRDVELVLAVQPTKT